MASIGTDAETLTHLPYAVEVVPDATTEGGVCYLARHPELPGCMAHGETPEEALENLEEARKLYIEALLERGVDVPLPHTLTTATRASRHEVIWTQLVAAEEMTKSPTLRTSPASS